MQDYDEYYEAIVHMARVKLLMNKHKGNIEDVHPDQLIEFAMRELHELREAIGNGSYMAIIEEIADVLNFVMAAGVQAIEEYRRRK